MVYRYDQILKKDKNKLFMIGIALVFAMTLMTSAFSSVSAAPVTMNGCTFDDSGTGLWTLQADCTVDARIDIPAGTTVDGDGHTMYASFDKTTNSNNAALGIIGADNVTVKNLTIDGTGGNPWPLAIHGINTYKSLNVTINDVVITNMSASGIVVNGSTVSVSDVTTSGSGWHGINVDQGSDGHGGTISEPSVLNIDGIMHQTDLLPIYLDDTTKIVSVNDTLSQYYSMHINLGGTHPNDLLYLLEPTGEITSPSTGQTVAGVINLEAMYQDWDNGFNDDAVDWAVRAGTCAAGTNTVFGNVDGFHAAYSWDGSDFSAAFDTTSVGDGEYCFIFNPRDDAGENNVRETVTFSIDNTAPDMPVHLSPANGTYTTTASLTHIDWTTVTDASEPVTYIYQSSHSFLTNLDGSLMFPVYTSGALTDSQIPTPGTPAGTYYWQVRAVDAAGNLGHWTSPWQVTVDNTAPQQVDGMTIWQNSVNIGCSAYVNERTITVDWNDSTDPNFDFYRYQADDGVGPIDFTTSPLVASQRTGNIRDLDGTYMYRVQAVDKSGNTGAYSDWCSVTLDRVAPVAAFVAPDTTTDGTPELTGTVDDPNATILVTVFGTTYPATNNGDGTWTLPDNTITPVLAVGAYDVTVEATDLAGNSSSSTSVDGLNIAGVLGATDTRDNGTTDKKVLGESTLSETGNPILSSVLLGTLLIVLPLILVATTNYSVESGSIKKQ